MAQIGAPATQPTPRLLYRLLAAAKLEPRIRLEPYDDHDDVLDQLAYSHPEQHAPATKARNTTLASLTNGR